MQIKLSHDEAISSCKLGLGPECCIYLLLGPDGFSCGKNCATVGPVLKKRLESGQSSAKGEGGWKGCALKEYADA